MAKKMETLVEKAIKQDSFFAHVLIDGVSYPVSYCNFGEDCVDRTNWRPDSDIVRNRLLSGNGGSGLVPQYDFPDGKDTGYRAPVRELGMDITEIDSAIEVIKQTAEKDEKAKADRKQAIADLTEALDAALTGNSDTTEDSDS